MPSRRNCPVLVRSILRRKKEIVAFAPSVLTSVTEVCFCGKHGNRSDPTMSLFSLRRANGNVV